jgi:hypothetical protein
VYANPRKPLPLPAGTQPISLKIPKGGRLVEWSPRLPSVERAHPQVERTTT